MNNTHNNKSSAPSVLPEPPAPTFPLVGLGASAGGIQALQTFFDNIPDQTGMAYVVIMHLSPDHESSLAQILQNRTAMPVVQVTEPTKVQPDHVYVIPPSKHLRLEDGHIHLVEPQQATGKRLAIDLFFRTLAATYGPRAVAVVLSGTDGDGSIGIKHVKEQGGLTIAQEPTEAEFDSMPRSAIATGMVDWTLPVGQMPGQLMEFLRNEARMHIPPEELQSSEEAQAEDRNSGGPPAIRKEPNVGDEEALLGVLHFLRAQTGHDFTHYKRATILRRVARRMQVNLLEDIPTYFAFLQAHPEETIALLHDLLISVTNFFRDAPSFAALQSHIPQLFADKDPADQLRVWVTGCATGEEAYSVAMLLLEHAEKLETPPAIQVFATDLDDNAIQVARVGLYPATIEVDVSPERLRRFFLKEEGRYRVKKEMRECVLFSAHNLLKDSPFSRLDLVTCRNLLIYLKREAQEGVFDLFHFALRAGGLLFLGSAESISDGHVLFAPLDRQHRLFVRRAMQRAGWQLPALPVSVPSRLRPSTSLSAPPRRLSAAETANENGESAPPLSSPTARRASSFGDLHLSLLEQFAPPSLVVNAAYDIVHLSEHAGRFLQFAGELSRNLLQVAHPALRLELQTALFRAAHQRINVTTTPIPFEEGTARFVTIHVRPAREAEETQEFLLVVFETADALNGAPAPAAEPADAVALHLQEEILHLRRQLSATVEQYEASVEELKASAEEQQSINEEMRSAAEELETSKEELQSTNEELTTVNQELKSNLDELGRANGDLQNLMASTEIGTIFLDRQLRIKRYTPRIRELFNIIPTDVGRPLSDITHKLNHHPFTEDAERVLADLSRGEREVRNNGQYFLARMLPYRTPDDYIDGVVLTFIDITERKKAEEALREAESRMRLIVESARDYAIFTTDLERHVNTWNTGAQALFGYTEAEILGRPGDILYTPADREAGAPQWEAEKAQNTGRAENERWHSRKDGSRFYGSGVVTPLHDDAGNHIGFVKVMRDLTEQKRTEEALAASEEQFRRAIEEAPIPIIMQAEDGAVLQISRTWTELTGYGLEDIPTFDAWLNIAYGEGANAVRTHMRDLFQGTKGIVDVEFSIRTRDGAHRHWSFSASSPGILHDGRRFIVGMALDITERKRAEEALCEAEEKYRLFVTAVSDILYIMSADWSEMRSLEGKGILTDTQNPSLSWLEKYIPASDKALAQAAITEAIRTKQMFELEHHVVRADGTLGWMFSRAIPLLDERGEIVEWFGAASDITERKHVEAALRASEEQYRSLFNSIDEGFCTIEVLFDAQGKAVDYRFIEANPAFARQTGLENALGRTIRELVPEHEASWFEIYGRIARTGEAIRFEHEAAALGKFYDVYAFRIGEPGDNRVAIIFNDILRRKRTEAALRKSEERLRIAVEAADMGTWDWDLLLEEVQWNERHFTLLGMQPQEGPVSPEEFFRHIYADDRNRIRERLEQSVRERVVFEAEFRIVREDGEVCWMSGYGNIVEEIEGKPTRMGGVMLDITRRKSIEEALRLSEERYRLTVENIRDYAIFTLDTQGHVTSWSEGARRIKRYEPHEIIGRHFRVFYIPEDQANRKPEHELEHAAATGRNEDESWRVRKDGTRFWGNEICTAMRDESGALRGFVKISRDLTERKRNEEERLALEHETTLLTERNRMAQELHDTLAQGFTGIRMQLEMAQSALQALPPDTEDGLQRVVRAREIAANSHQEARRSIRALRAPLLDNATLPQALERLTSEVSDGVEVGFALEGAPFPLSALVENDLYRIGQEGVTNALRHSGAQRIVLTLTYFEDQVHLSVQDNGKGFDPNTGRTGFGVTGMQERARRLGAELQVASRTGEGTQVNLAYPLPAGQSRSAT